MASTLMLLSNPHRPDPRVLREARALMEAGIGVRLVAWDREGGRPERAVEEGVEVIRLGPRSAYRSFSQVAPGLLRFWARAARVARRLDFDVVHCHDFDTLPLGLTVARLSGKPLILDAHDIYSLMIVGESPIVGRMLWPVERWMASKTDRLITTNETMAQMLSSRVGAAPAIVTNSPDTAVLSGHSREDTRKKHGLTGFVVSYFGSLEPGRAVEELATAFSPGDGITVVIGGNGTLRPTVERAAMDNPSVRFLGTLGTDEVLRITDASDIVPVMYDPSNPKYRICTPIKVLEAMACGRPMITTKGLDISETVEGVGCGMVIQYDREELAKTIREAARSPDTLAEMGRRGRDYFDRKLGWEASRTALTGVYRALLGPM
ncbi:TPA: glycosyltransferase family 4 protein [Thermoplasmata archaeon]|nr:glycosyltransferase family 4 protein [Thermoplasmata archaeon]